MSETAVPNILTYLGLFDENIVMACHKLWFGPAVHVILLQVIAQIYCVIHSGFVSQKLLRVAVNCLHILHIRSTQNIHNW